MPHIICQPCETSKDTSCAEVCPVDCIHPRRDEADFDGAPQLYINPEDCIDCGACVPACPVEAIYSEDEVPDRWRDYIDRNYEYYGLER